MPYTFTLTVDKNTSTTSRRGNIYIKPYNWSIPDFNSPNQLFFGANGDTTLDIVQLATGGGHPFSIYMNQAGKPAQPDPEPTGSTETGTVSIMFNTSLRYVHAEVKFGNNNTVVYDTMGGVTVTNPYNYTIKNGTYNVTATGSYRQTQTQLPMTAQVTVKPSSITVNSNTVSLTVTISGGIV